MAPLELGEILDVPEIIVEHIMPLLATNLLIIQHHSAPFGCALLLELYPSFNKLLLSITSRFHSILANVLLLWFEINTLDSIKLRLNELPEAAGIHIRWYS